MELIIRGKEIHYGWITVLAGMLITSVGIGAFFSTNSIFVKPVCDELGFSRGEYTFHRTLVTLVGVFMLPFFGKLVRRVGIRRMLLVSTVVLSLLMMGYSLTTELWHFYALAVINGVFMHGLNFVIVGMLVSEWFHDKKGLATGLAYAGSGIGGAVMVPLMGQFIEAFGWRWGFRFIGLMGVVLLIPVILLLVRNNPESMGLRPYVDPANAHKQEGDADVATSGMTLQQALRTPTFWLLTGSFFLIAISAAGPNTHTVPYLTDLGYSTVFATSVFSFFMIVLTAGKVALGGLFDKFGTLLGSLFVGITCMAFPILALFAQNPAAPWAYAFFLGLASSGFSVPVTVLVIHHFGRKDLPLIFSVSNMVTTLGSAASVPMMGFIYDATGEYRVAWLVLAVCGVLLTAGLVAADLSGRRRGVRPRHSSI